MQDVLAQGNPLTPLSEYVAWFLHSVYPHCFFFLLRFLFHNCVMYAIILISFLCPLILPLMSPALLPSHPPPHRSHFHMHVFCFVTHWVERHLCDHGFGTIYWSVVGSPVETRLKAMTAPFPESTWANRSAGKE